MRHGGSSYSAGMIAGVSVLISLQPLVAAATKSGKWQWQLRDAKGRWIQMGSSVIFMHNGQPVTGTVVGSPGPGKASVKLPNGSVITVSTAGVTVAAGARPAKPQKASVKGGTKGGTAKGGTTKGGSSGTGAKARIKGGTTAVKRAQASEKGSRSGSSSGSDEPNDR